MNNCKNCGARYHPSECDYCGTPHATEAVNMKGQQVAYLQGSLSYESARQLYNGKGLVQLTVPPHRSIRGTFWTGMLQGLGFPW